MTRILIYGRAMNAKNVKLYFLFAFLILLATAPAKSTCHRLCKAKSPKMNRWEKNDDWTFTGIIRPTGGREELDFSTMKSNAYK